MPRKKDYEICRARRAAWIAENGPCQGCGSDQDLEVDHIDPATKAVEAWKIWQHTEAKRVAELAKCQVLCNPCHILKSTAESRARATGVCLRGHEKEFIKGWWRCRLCERARYLARSNPERRYDVW